MNAPSCRICAAALSWSMAFAAFGSDVEVDGAGASFPAPVMRAWAAQYAQQGKIDIQYRSVGSGEGIRRLTSRSVQFAMTDMPLTQWELTQNNLLQFPVVVGAVVPVVNLPNVGPGQLRLSGEVLADIFLGDITEWNAPALRALNPGVELPNLAISVVYRAESSGTSFVFTRYLSRVSKSWQRRPGTGSRLLWPVGTGVRGNEGMVQAVRSSIGTIGYVESSYLPQNNVSSVRLSNQSGHFVLPDARNVADTVAAIKWTRASFYEVVSDRGGETTWPIVGISFALVPTDPKDVTVAAATFDFFDWIYRQGASLAAERHYVPLTEGALVQRIEASWASVRDASGRTLWKAR
jgi:phosphate transport system substrate-binding protein